MKRTTAFALFKEGKGHGWNLEPDLAAIADWFDENLRGMKAKDLK